MTGSADIPRLRVGTDLVHVTEVSESIETFGDRYLGRVFTPAELATCRSTDGWSAGRLAARFAAKEAATKILRPQSGLSYHAMEVVLDEFGAPALMLHDTAKRRADDLGLRETSLSMSHDGEYALAVIAAVFAADNEDTTTGATSND